jgi:hypothetical protein
MMPKEYQFPVFLVAALLVSGLSTSRAEENCLLAPNARAPQGSHWYYRTDPTSQNKCWHLRAEGQTDEQPIQQQKPEQAGASAAATPPLPRPAPNGLRQRSTSAPTEQAGSRASVGFVDPAAAQSGAELRGGLSASPPPPAPTTNTNVVWGDPPSGAVTAPAPSSASSDNALARPSTNNAGAEARLEEKPNAVLKQQRLGSDNAEPEKVVPADDEASYNVISLTMLSIIVAGVIVVGIFIRALVRIGFARREAIAVEEFNADLPAEAEKIQTSEGALRQLLHILEYEPNNRAHRSATPHR